MKGNEYVCSNVPKRPAFSTFLLYFHHKLLYKKVSVAELKKKNKKNKKTRLFTWIVYSYMLLTVNIQTVMI